MQSAYRSGPTAPPLITWSANSLIAMEPLTGELLWERNLDQGVARLLLTDRLIVLATNGPNHGSSSSILLVDLATGADRAKVDAKFWVKAALRSGDLLVFSGSDGTMAMRMDGSIVWRAVLEVVEESAWSGNKYDLVGRDSAGRVIWRLRDRHPYGAALAIGDAIAQPDFDT